MATRKIEPGQLDKLNAVALLREYTWLQIRMTDRISKVQRKKERKLATQILTAMSSEPLTEDDIDTAQDRESYLH